MSRPEKLIPLGFEEAVAELKRDPSHPVHARVDGLDFELRIIPSNETQPGVGSRLAAIGPHSPCEGPTRMHGCSP